MSCILNENKKDCIVAGYSEREKKTLIFSHSEIIENFLEQEKQGAPHYAVYEKGAAIKESAGFLIWSLWDGCGVAHRRADGVIVLLTGMQGDFCYI